MDAFGGTQPHVRPLEPSDDPYEMYSRISKNHARSFLFESLTGPEVLSETSVMGFDPSAVVRGYADRVEVESKDGTETIETKRPFAEVQRLLRDARYDGRRYLGGAVGTVNYDAVRLVEDVPDSGGAAGLLMEFGMYDDGIIYDRQKKELAYFYYAEDRLDELGCSADKEAKFSASDPEPSPGPEEFARMVERAKRYIHDGDIFQVVLSRRFAFECGGGELALYDALRRLNPSPYMYHLKAGDRRVVGASPEMLVRVTGKKVETFPIAGTRKITGDAGRDAQLAAELLKDEKELAEHTMLVDLGRNDIGRVCRYGTVRPESLMQVRRFSHVQHMVTHLSGELGEKKGMFDAFEAVFPAGTVSGAPKVRAMEIIDELERHPRGPYAGAVGYFSHNGCCDFAIAIRSIFLDGKHGFVQAGAGIVSDSVAENEFKETEQKAGAMLQAIREASG